MPRCAKCGEDYGSEYDACPNYDCAHPFVGYLRGCGLTIVALAVLLFVLIRCS